jgi:hypothetical protein
MVTNFQRTPLMNLEHNKQNDGTVPTFATQVYHVSYGDAIESAFHIIPEFKNLGIVQAVDESRCQATESRRCTRG